MHEEIKTVCMYEDDKYRHFGTREIWRRDECDTDTLYPINETMKIRGAAEAGSLEAVSLGTR